MKFKYYEAADVICYDYAIPGFKILDEEYRILDALASLSGKYIREIVENLEKVRGGSWIYMDFDHKIQFMLKQLDIHFIEKNLEINVILTGITK